LALAQWVDGTILNRVLSISNICFTNVLDTMDISSCRNQYLIQKEQLHSVVMLGV